MIGAGGAGIAMSEPIAGNGNAVDFFLDRHVREGNGAAPAFTDAARSLSYGALHAESHRFATALAACGIGRERRVCLLLFDTVEFPVAFWGCLRAGVIPVPVNTLLPPAIVAHILADSRAEAVFVSAPLRAGLDSVFATVPTLRHVVAVGKTPDSPGAALPYADFLARGSATAETVAVSPDEVAVWFYSSGSTGAPKGVRHVHGSLRATADTYAAHVLGIRTEDVVFSAAKLFFSYGFGNSVTFPMSVGAASVLLAERPTAESVLHMLRTHRPSIFCGVPTLYASLLAQRSLSAGAGSDRLRRCVSAGEPLPEQIGRQWRARVGVDILDGIGSTEMLHIFLSNRPDDLRYGTTGRAVPGYDLRIVDAEGQDVKDGEPGELLVRGPSAADGYWNQRDKTRRTFRGEWTHTGDVYVRDGEGYYTYKGRNDDMLKVSGIWVSPFEVEGALIAHPAVLEAAVVGHQDTEGLVKPRAFVVLRPDATGSDPARLRDELKAHVKEKVGPWKYPRWIEIVDSLPKTATGKIQRFRLREQA
jgi:4-hydroxybenzoate-CoA ligase